QPRAASADSFSRCLGLRLDGDANDEMDDAGKPIKGETFLVLFNADRASVSFALPADETGRGWEVVLDTRTPEVGGESARHVRAGGPYDLGAHSLAVLRRHAAQRG